MEIISKKCFLLVSFFVLLNIQTRASPAEDKYYNTTVASIVSPHGYFPIIENTSRYCNFGNQSSGVYHPFLPASISRTHGAELVFGMNHHNAYQDFWNSPSQLEPCNVLYSNLWASEEITSNKSILIEKQLDLDYYYRKLANIVVQHNFDALVYNTTIEAFRADYVKFVVPSTPYAEPNESVSISHSFSFKASTKPNTETVRRKLLVEGSKRNGPSRVHYANNIYQVGASFFFITGIVMICVQIQTRRNQSQVSESHEQANTSDDQEEYSNMILKSCSKYYLFGGVSSAVGVLIFLVRFVFERANST